LSTDVEKVVSFAGEPMGTRHAAVPRVLVGFLLDPAALEELRAIAKAAKRAGHSDVSQQSLVRDALAAALPRLRERYGKTG
jgi:hypothetical protein